MTIHKNFKRQVRARAARTGESYTAALRHFRSAPSGALAPDLRTPGSVRLAVAQTPSGRIPATPTRCAPAAARSAP